MTKCSLCHERCVCFNCVYEWLCFGVVILAAAFGMSSSSPAAAAVRSAAPPTYQVDKLDGRSLLPDMYAGTKEEYMRIPANNLQGDKAPVHKFARHS